MFESRVRADSSRILPQLWQTNDLLHSLFLWLNLGVFQFLRVWWFFTSFVTVSMPHPNGRFLVLPCWLPRQVLLKSHHPTLSGTSLLSAEITINPNKTRRLYIENLFPKSVELFSEKCPPKGHSKHRFSPAQQRFRERRSPDNNGSWVSAKATCAENPRRGFGWVLPVVIWRVMEVSWNKGYP